MESNVFKTSKTIKEYEVKDFFGHRFTVPVGSIVNNSTCQEYDDKCYFWEDWSVLAKEITGYENSILAHDLCFHGLNIPEDYCESYNDSGI